MTPILIPLHGIGGRQDLPLPFPYVLAGAAIAVAASFLVLGLAWRTSRYTSDMGGIPIPWLTRVVDAEAVRWIIRIIGLLIGGWALMALLFGPDLLINPIFGFLYVWVWVGLVPLSLLCGRLWFLLNPLRSLYLIGCRLAGADPDRAIYTLPKSRVGRWPAVIGLFAFVYLELVAPDRATIPIVLLFVAFYVVTVLFGAVLFGQSWISAADPFDVYADLVANLSPWFRVNSTQPLRLRSPLANLAALTPTPGTFGFVAVLLGSTAYDGFSNSTTWVSWIQDQPIPGVVAATLTLLAMITAVILTFTGAARAAGRLSGSWLAAQPSLFVHSLLPIALGYVTAHYLTLFIFEGQRTALLWSDPLAKGWNVFGTAELGVNYSLTLYPAVIAVAQAGAVIIGHIIGVIAAHDRALQLTSPAKAVVGQTPMLILMVGYTVSGLLLLFSQ